MRLLPRAAAPLGHTFAGSRAVRAVSGSARILVSREALGEIPKAQPARAAAVDQETPLQVRGALKQKRVLATVLHLASSPAESTAAV